MSRKERLRGQQYSLKVERDQQKQRARYQTDLSHYKALEKRFSRSDVTDRQRIIGMILLAMVMSSEVINLTETVREGVSRVPKRENRTHQKTRRGQGELQPQLQSDYGVLRRDFQDKSDFYENLGVSEEGLSAAEFLSGNLPDFYLGELAGEFADFEERVGTFVSVSNVRKFVEGAIIAGSLASGGSIKKDLRALLAVVAMTSAIPNVEAHKTREEIRKERIAELKQAFLDYNELTAGAKRIGWGVWLNYHLKMNIFGIPGLWHQVPQNYKEDRELMDFLEGMVGVNGISSTAKLIRTSLAMESYSQAAAFLEVVKDHYKFDSFSEHIRKVLGEIIFSQKDFGYDHFFGHLLAIPMSQGEVEAQSYHHLLEVTTDFLLGCGLSIEDFLKEDKYGNNPLHVMAAVAPLNQFELFCSSFADLISDDMWDKKNKQGYSAREILQDDEVQGRAIRDISQAMKSSFNVHTSVESHSDMLHLPGSMEVFHDVKKSDSIVIPKSRGKRLASYPKEAYVRREDGDYDVLNLLDREEVLEVVPKEQYDEVEGILPGGTSYAKLAFDSREGKLEVLNRGLKKGVVEGVKVPESKVRITQEEPLVRGNDDIPEREL